VLPVFDLNTPQGRAGLDERLEDLRASTSASSEPATVVAQIIQDVAAEGDAAVVRYMRKWTDPQFEQDRIRVNESEISAARDALDPMLAKVLETAIEHVRAYQEHIKPEDADPITIDGARMGLRFVPVDSVGLLVPGGKASYPSSVIMLAVPAQASGVAPENISVVTPPPTRTDEDQTNSPTDVSPLVLATCALLGITRVYRIGGAQAAAALALGTDTVKPVDMIVGPGNVYTQLAKQQLSGRVGIDGFYGPSEIVTIADNSADPRRVASDLIAQAEHDPGRCFLISWSQQLIDKVNDELADQLVQRQRKEAIEASFAESSAALLVADETQAVTLADSLAAEHVNLAVAAPQALLERVRHGGEFFLGDTTPVAAGDYYAGPSHCLPTGTTARFTSGVSVYTFLKRSGWVHYEKGMSQQTIDAIAALAEAEGLDGHAASVRTRSQ